MPCVEDIEGSVASMLASRRVALSQDGPRKQKRGRACPRRAVPTRTSPATRWSSAASVLPASGSVSASEQCGGGTTMARRQSAGGRAPWSARSRPDKSIGRANDCAGSCLNGSATPSERDAAGSSGAGTQAEAVDSCGFSSQVASSPALACRLPNLLSKLFGSAS